MTSFLDCCIAWARFNDELDSDFTHYYGKTCNVQLDNYPYNDNLHSIVKAHLTIDTDQDQGLLLSGLEKWDSIEYLGLMDLPLEEAAIIITYGSDLRTVPKSNNLTRSAFFNESNWRFSVEFLKWRLKNGIV